jgi:hypothetical protein
MELSMMFWQEIVTIFSEKLASFALKAIAEN